MPNRPQQKKAEKGKYAGRMYLDYAEAGDYLGIKKVTLHKYMATLGIHGVKFELEKKHFIAIDDVRIMERVIAEPWMVNELKKRPSKPPEEIVA